MTKSEHETVMTFAFLTAVLAIAILVFISNAVSYYRSNKLRIAERKRIEKITKTHKK